MRDTTHHPEDDRRKRFYPTISLGSIISLITILAGGLGVYTTMYADVSTNKVEIRNIKIDLTKKEVADRELRQELKADVKEVKEDVKSLTEKIDRVLFEVRRGRGN